MPDLPEDAVRAAAEALAEHFNHPDPDSWEKEARAALVAALPHLQRDRKPRTICPVCGKDVVRRGDGNPVVHYAKDNNPEFTCKGDMFSRCRGGCPCPKHR